jgi:hypothetical protein
MVLGYMFRPHCGHLQSNLYRLSAPIVRTVWDPIMCTIMTYVRQKNTVKKRIVTSTLALICCTTYRYTCIYTYTS